ncbi:MAG: DNA double-strand break repair nuclease NurA [Anaerolineales bacterium]|nr:MAG: DNA double-strand break repair nuclease NurA [Anaerolineales bacterium]
MPTRSGDSMLHIERLSKAIDSMGKSMLNQRANQRNDLSVAMGWLRSNLSNAVLQKRLQSIIESEAGWEGVIPCTNHPLDETFAVPATRPESVTLIGVDGSQIFPDRHGAVLYYLIQCGALIFRYNGSLPEPQSTERLYFEDELLFDRRGYLISNDAIGIQRTAQEMLFAAHLCALERKNHPQAGIFSIIDGPLLWPYLERGHHITPEFEAYLSGLTEIRQNAVTPAGYVDRPGGKWFLNLLWINQLPNEEPITNVECPLHTLTDARLMEIILAPGDRTAWYKRHSETQKKHARAGHEIWFCYINLGEVESPSIARIELPFWFAHEETGIRTLHNALRHQAQVLNGYPYVLARAHEQALVTIQDKAALDMLLQRIIMEQGIMPSMSDKARQKSYLGHRQ